MGSSEVVLVKSPSVEGVRNFGVLGWYEFI